LFLSVETKGSAAFGAGEEAVARFAEAGGVELAGVAFGSGCSAYRVDVVVNVRSMNLGVSRGN
jgi:hypothetical protein